MEPSVIRLRLHRLDIVVLADEREDLLILCSVVPAPSWDEPPVLGYRGFLERLRFGRDPGHANPGAVSFFFGSTTARSAASQDELSIIAPKLMMPVHFPGGEMYAFGMSTWAFTIDTVTEDALDEAIRAARLYVHQVPPPIRRTIGLIHGLGRLHQRASLHQLDIYLGRSGDTPKSLLSRWKAHRDNPARRHKYGAVLFRSEPRRAAKLEGVANRALLKLQRENKLCVGIANVAPNGAGGYGRDVEYSAIYMTWRVMDEEIEYERPKLSDVRELAQAAASPEDGLHSQKLENGLMALRRLSYTERLEWYRP